MTQQKKLDFSAVYELLGERIRLERKKKNLTLLDLSVLCGVSELYISQIENAKRKNISLGIYFQIIYFLEISPDVFFQTYKIQPLLTSQLRIIDIVYK